MFKFQRKSRPSKAEMRLPRRGRGKKRSSQSSSQDNDSSPPKRLHLSPKPGLADLNGKALQRVFSYLSLNGLSRLAMSSRSLASHIFNFSLSVQALPTLFPSISAHTLCQHNCQLIVLAINCNHSVSKNNCN